MTEGKRHLSGEGPRKNLRPYQGQHGLSPKRGFVKRREKRKREDQRKKQIPLITWQTEIRKKRRGPPDEEGGPRGLSSGPGYILSRGKGRRRGHEEVPSSMRGELCFRRKGKEKRARRGVWAVR